MVEKLVDHPSIHVHLNKKFSILRNQPGNMIMFFIQAQLMLGFNYEFGRLAYRTLFFETSVHEGDFQGTAQINYCDEHIPFTRITEHKHFAPWETA